MRVNFHASAGIELRPSRLPGEGLYFYDVETGYIIMFIRDFFSPLYGNTFPDFRSIIKFWNLWPPIEFQVNNKHFLYFYTSLCYISPLFFVPYSCCVVLDFILKLHNYEYITFVSMQARRLRQNAARKKTEQRYL